MRRSLIVLALTTALAAAGCGGSSSSGGSTARKARPAPSAPAAKPPSSAARYGCQTVTRPRPKPNGTLKRPTLTLKPAHRYVAVLSTTCGPISIDLDVAQQPRTAASFVYLIRHHFYDGLTFHRISHLPNGMTWVIQGGDPLGTGEGGPGYTVVETPPPHARYTFGTVAMAKTQAQPNGASGSQFFIVTTADAGLPPQYAIVGHVSGGTKTVQRIAAVPSDPQTEQPVIPIVIRKATVGTRGPGG